MPPSLCSMSRNRSSRSAGLWRRRGRRRVGGRGSFRQRGPGFGCRQCLGLRLTLTPPTLWFWVRGRNPGGRGRRFGCGSSLRCVDRGRDDPRRNRLGRRCWHIPRSADRSLLGPHHAGSGMVRLTAHLAASMMSATMAWVSLAFCSISCTSLIWVRVRTRLCSGYLVAK